MIGLKLERSLVEFFLWISIELLFPSEGYYTRNPDLSNNFSEKRTEIRTRFKIDYRYLVQGIRRDGYFHPSADKGSDSLIGRWLFVKCDRNFF